MIEQVGGGEEGSLTLRIALEMLSQTDASQDGDAERCGSYDGWK